MSAVEAFIGLAAKQVGVREGRDRKGNWNNDVSYNEWYARLYGREYRYTAWCAVFVSWCARHAGIPTSVIPDHAWTPSGYSWFKKRGRAVSTPQRGDIFYVYYPRQGMVGHIGIVTGVSGGRVHTIEGNTNTGGSAQGNGVYRLTRPITGNLRFVRPDWAAAGGGASAAPSNNSAAPAASDMPFPGAEVFQVGNAHDAIKLMGHRLRAHGFQLYEPTATFTTSDVATVAAFQRAQGWTGSDADGIPGPETWKRLMQVPQVSLSALVQAARSDGPRPQGGTTPGAADDVFLVERALYREGLLNGDYADDGSFGTSTVSAYSGWQSRLGYTGSDADGIPGRTSLEKLGDKYGFQVID